MFAPALLWLIGQNPVVGVIVDLEQLGIFYTSRRFTGCTKKKKKRKNTTFII